MKNTSKRLEILQKSLLKKEDKFEDKLQNHFSDVKRANGQPMNDKRNGHVTLNKWERQNESLRVLQNEIEKTKSAIEFEAGKIAHVESVKESLPLEIVNLIKIGEITQWRKFPNMFFVAGVDKARIVWDKKRNLVAHRYAHLITDQAQRSKFVKIYNGLHVAINPQ